MKCEVSTAFQYSLITSPQALMQLLASFSQAQRRGLSDLADLYYNRAALHTYCQAFSEALGDYRRAAELDSTLPVGAQV